MSSTTRSTTKSTATINNLTSTVPTMEFRQSPLYHYLPIIAVTVLSFQIIYKGSIHLFTNNPKLLNSWLPPASPEFCIDTPEALQSCSRYDLVAFQLVSTLAFYTCGILAIFNSTHKYFVAYSTPTGRLFGSTMDAYSRNNTIITVVNFSYQLWDFVASMSIPEHCTVVMMCHHLIAALACFVTLRYHCMGTYSHFYLGCSEISSLMLVWLDLTRFFVPIPGSLLDVFMHQFVAPLFLVAFTYYRVIRWWPVTYNFFTDLRSYKNEIKKKHDIDDKSASSTKNAELSLTFIAALAVPMGILQLFWFVLIIRKGLEIISIN